jgi:hypothetical protein
MAPSVLKSTSKTIASLCTPAALYGGFGCLSLIMLIYEKYSISAILLKALFIIGYTWLLNFLCLRGHTGISWFLVLLPFILLFITMVMVADVFTKL